MNSINEPYLEEDDNFYDTNNETGDNALSGRVNSGLGDESTAHLTEEEKQKQREEWQQELLKTEEEIQTLRQVLSSKLRYAGELKRKLGISPLTEMRHDLQHGLENIKSTDTFQKTAAVVRVAKDKTSTTLNTASTKVSEKWSVLKNSNTYKSFEGKMGTAYFSLKNKFSANNGSTGSANDPTNQTTPGAPASTNDAGSPKM